MFWAIIGGIVSVVLIMWMTFWVTRKAYSKKWEDPGDRDQ